MDAIILGAGIAGLTASYHLKRKGFSFLLLEKTLRCGGCLHTVTTNGTLLEKGPNSFLSSHDTLMAHAKELGLTGEMIQARESSKNRFVLRRGKLISFPTSPAQFLKTPLLTPLGKLRLILEPLIAARSLNGEESIAQFVTRRLGKQALNLVKPMIHGIYAGDCEHLSIQAVAPKITEWEREYGSLFKALKKTRLLSQGQTLYSFKGGMQTLTDALYQTIQKHCQLECQDIAITKLKEGWKVQWKHQGGLREEEARVLILGLPAFEAARLLEDSNPGLALQLNTVPYAPLAVIHLVVERSFINHPLNGFGFLSGAGGKNFLLGCLWSSSIFENRCPDSLALLTCFVGGAKNPTILQEGEDQIISKVLNELRQIFGSSFRIEEASLTRHTKALPQYTLGHPKKLEKIRAHLQKSPGLYLTGNYWEGISVNDTMKNAVHVASLI
ncbi:MAG: protoporphyrinogen oxidase [Deltaproteobacteria bacterium RIFCSPLOWO2_12_FULL_44_12]|nr:MAG: protoporphyrinogen oxidase [Deltaproteobacteria bacterium RIFCSPHIGHO2_01_FULL_43_49]OGQ15277.1 MAG: protoporphyrinogen oxidase [Deltaproteobacteria bacterium RIFCSPHIGHO2_02_FULL_44_53]OGQ27099.1 MAG: protoporphyrinogen oxidase [Deltaproteobacteria bacterium RIFCSPHIGHO2_12_FULL_44_21]OGQ31793.1 MAG: protoporphyrinogen oxidase [Deltaproteobacteria bacterium RIFCSPLOWO2_01_FULL_45_74]OGQ42995.1 MAG: protoporphyrinogen oxidase [Deltaproteobacteria bacterium RIFCSPLOWO2_02_FULL_44_34]OGQ